MKPWKGLAWKDTADAARLSVVLRERDKERGKVALLMLLDEHSGFDLYKLSAEAETHGLRNRLHGYAFVLHHQRCFTFPPAPKVGPPEHHPTR
jgi:hypothetical protein